MNVLPVQKMQILFQYTAGIVLEFRTSSFRLPSFHIPPGQRYCQFIQQSPCLKPLHYRSEISIPLSNYNLLGLTKYMIDNIAKASQTLFQCAAVFLN